jgi:hypothetical protein
VCVDVAGQPSILISQRSDSKSATDHTFPCMVTEVNHSAAECT